MLSSIAHTANQRGLLVRASEQRDYPRAISDACAELDDRRRDEILPEVTVAAAVVAGSCHEVDCRAEPGNLVV